MLRFKSALSLQTAQRSLRLSRQPTGAGRGAAEQRKIGKHLLMVLLTLSFIKLMCYL